MKQCTKCKKLLPEIEFHSCKQNKDGLQYKCKQCNGQGNITRQTKKKYWNTQEIMQNNIDRKIKKKSKNMKKQERNIIAIIRRITTMPIRRDV